MNLLERIEDRGYPLEYLLSRIRGRRAGLIHDWESVVRDTEISGRLLSRLYPETAVGRAGDVVWRMLLKEYKWVFTQMNMRLRVVFWHYFLYSELRTLFICMRHIKQKNTARLNELLSASLLSHEIKDGLRQSSSIQQAAHEIESSFLSLSHDFRGLAEIAVSKGLMEFEQRLTNTYLGHTQSTELHPVMKDFFTGIIDARNIISLYKYLRFEASAQPPFLPGGRIRLERLNEIMDGKDIFGLVSLIRESSGIELDISATSRVEHALYTGMTRRLDKAGRDPLGLGLILYYLWRISIEAMNLSLILHSREQIRETVLNELIT